MNAVTRDAASEPAPPAARTRYLWFLLALFSVQTGARIAFSPPMLNGSWIPAALLHLWLISVFLVVVALIIAQLPRRWRGMPLAAAVITVVLGCAHAAMTLFDAVQYYAHYYAGMDAPVWLAVTDPKQTLSLLYSMDIRPAQIALVLALVFTAHLLLYWPVADAIVRLTHRAVAAALPIGGGRRLGMVWVGMLWVVVFALTDGLVPDRYWKREALHRGYPSNFQMGPPDLMMSAHDPAPMLGPTAPLPGARPLILIIVDALRSDRMELYNPSAAPTPFLNGLRDQGKLKLYPSYSTCSFSACGIMSILASRSWDDFGRRPPTLFDALAVHSYHSTMLLAGNHSDFGLLTQLYGSGIISHDQKLGRQSDEVLLKTLHEASFPDPAHSFLYLHMISTHAGSYLRPRYRLTADPGGVGSSKESPDAYARQYDLRVSQTDEMLREVFVELQAKGLLNNALVIITADHGERIGERGLYYHGGAADGPVTTTPLIIYDASGAAYADRLFASQIDIAPTFLTAVGATPLSGWRGHALQQPGWPGAVPIGTYENTGVVAALPGGPYRYLCDRESGVERVERIDGSPSGTEVRNPGALLPRLRALHRAIAEPPPGRCRH